MRQVVAALVAVTAACAAPATDPAGGPEAQVPRLEERVPRSQQQIRLSFAPVVRAAAPAVVNVYTRKAGAESPLSGYFADPFFQRFFRDFLGPGQPRRHEETSLGSGVLIRADGLVVTNYHVVEDAQRIMVVLSDRREFAATVIGADEPSDLALLDIDAGGQDLPVLPLGDSDQLEVGDLVLAIGNPFGIGQTVTSGIVSAIARTTPGLGSNLSFIQTDAAINPGNSGGALVTVDGELVGINTAIFSRSGGSIGIGFAIPVNLVKALLRSIEGGEDGLARPWFGASVQAVDGDLAEALGLDRPRGVVIQRLIAGGPAERAGLAPGDVVLAVDGVEVLDERGLNFRLAVGDLGDEAALDVWRRGRRLTLTLPLEEPPYQPEPDVTRLAGHHPLAGATVANLSPGLNRDLGLDLARRGVIVLEVARRSPAARLGLGRGDVLARAGDTEVESVDQLAGVLADVRPPWRLEVVRRGRRLSVVLGR